MSDAIKRFKAVLPRPPRRNRKKVTATPPDPDAASPQKADNRQWAVGRKYHFLSSRIEAWRDAAALDKVSEFYDNVTVAWLAMWGWDTPTESDVPPLVEDPTAADIEAVFAATQATSEESQRRRRIFWELHGRIQRWFRHHGSKSLKAQKTDPMAKILADFTDATAKAPRRHSSLQFYQRTYYESRIKPAVDAEYERLCKEAAESNAPPPVKITLVNRIAKEMYAAESVEFKAKLDGDLEMDYQERLAKHQAAMTKSKVPSTAEEYHAELQASGHWLHAFAEHVSNRLGMNITIFLAGPIGENSGEIGVRCVNAGRSQTLVPMVWAEYDQPTFNVVSKSMIKFAHSCFSPEDCRARALPPSDTAGAVTGNASPGPAQAIEPSSPTVPTAKHVAVPDVSPAAPILSHAAARALSVGRARSVSTSPPASTPLRHMSLPPVNADVSISLPQLENTRGASAPPPDGLGVAGNSQPADDVFVDSAHVREHSDSVASRSRDHADLPARTTDTEASQAQPEPINTAKTVPLPAVRPAGDAHAASLPAPTQKGTGAVDGTSITSERRASSSNPPSHTPSDPRVPTHLGSAPLLLDLNDCPKDVVDTAKYLVGDGGWGPRWRELVAAYVAIERRGTARGRLPNATDHRPAEVAQWMKYGRPSSGVAVEDVSKFEQCWWTWWRANQPTAGQHGEVPTAWQQLAVTGPNGIVLFLLSSAWWGVAVQGAEVRHQQAWLDAIEDMLFVFKQILQCLEDGAESAPPASVSRKRAAASTGGKAPKKRKA